MKRFLIVFILLPSLGLFTLFAQSQPKIKNGILDLRGGKLKQFKEIDFTGEWEFYWEQILTQSDFENNPDLTPNAIINVPNYWSSISIDGEELPAHGYGTYRIQVLIDKEIEPMAIKFGSMGTAFEAYINDKLLKNAGVVADNPNDAEPGYTTGIAIFQPPADTFNIIIPISNYHYCKGGLWNNISTIGNAESIQESWSRGLELLLLLLGTILIIAIYHIGIFQLNRFFKSALYFSLFCIVIGIRALMVNEIYILQLIPKLNWTLLVKVEYMTLMFGSIVFVYFMNDVFIRYKAKYFSGFIIIANILSIVVVAVTSVSFFTSLLLYFQVILLMAAVYSLVIVIKALLKKERTAQILIIGLIVLLGTIINDVLYVGKIIDTAYITTYGFIFFIVNQAYMLSYQFQKMFNETKNLAYNLEKINTNLESTVIERTQEIREQNSKLKEQNEEIKAQRDNIEKQHQLVTKQKQVITDSINYAQRIQHAVMPSENIFSGHLKEHFIFYKPRDIVSGDFYWFTTKENKIIIVAADCTGHGVPGAFMSMLGMAFLAEISRMPDVSTPAQILEFMREKVKQSLHQYDEKSLQKEGMDMALCMYDPSTQIMEFAGAYSPLYIIRNNEILIHKGDRQPVAVYLREKEFTNNEIKIEPDDRLYIFSDGYPDQTNGRSLQKYMVKNFRNLLLDIHKLPMQEQKSILEKTLAEWKSDGPQIDDILVIGFQL